jgi:hypothetical protein
MLPGGSPQLCVFNAYSSSLKPRQFSWCLSVRPCKLCVGPGRGRCCVALCAVLRWAHLCKSLSQPLMLLPVGPLALLLHLAASRSWWWVWRLWGVHPLQAGSSSGYSLLTGLGLGLGLNSLLCRVVKACLLTPCSLGAAVCAVVADLLQQCCRCHHCCRCC